MIRVAIASRDGKFIHQHFGHAESFLVFEIDGDRYTCIDVRVNKPACHQHEHDDDAMARSIDLIHDCQAVLASRIGPGAQARLIEHGIHPFEIADFIDHALQRLVSSGYLQTFLA